jgi:uncharacterized protein GlcG (DUF336 family)
MYRTNRPVIKKLSELYHSVGQITGDIEVVQTKSASKELKSELQYLEQKLNKIQEQILKTVIEDVIDDYRQQPSRPADGKLSLQQAVALVGEVEKKAAELNLSVITAVYNEAAHPITIHCMDDAYIASFDIASNKAYTSVALKMPTSVLKNLSQPGQELYGIQYTNQGRIVIFGGGMPLLLDGRLIGGIGVSGGTEEQDTWLAEYGSSKLKEVMT